MGNIFASYVKASLPTPWKRYQYMTFLADWYTDNNDKELASNGGGIAETSLFVLCLCYIQTWSARIRLSGAISAR
jgi:hypothetical protein